MGAFGSTVPSAIAAPSPDDPAGSFPRTIPTYTSPDGGIIVPPGALDRWWQWRATGGAERRELIVYGDSTTFGAGGNYSWLQRLRDRAVEFGLPDGGKGIFAGQESELEYDPPEVNGLVGGTFGGGFPDTFDNLSGSYYYDTGVPSGHTLELQFRSTAFRLWYSARGNSGDFTYSVDGGPTVTVHAFDDTQTASRFVYVSGLAPDVTHTIEIVNSGGEDVYVALAPVNETGLAIQKHAVSGNTFNNVFFGALGLTAPYTQAIDGMRYQSALGLNHVAVTSNDRYRGATVDTSYDDEARVRPIVAVTHLGFNDLTNAVEGDTQAWNEYVKRFAGACYDADCDGIVVSGQLPYNDNWETLGPDRFTALRDEALTQGLTFVDLFTPIGGPSLDYAAGPTNPHLTKPQYQDQADYAWYGLLGLA